MESVGQKLRVARMKLGLTLEEVSANTRISVRNLQALETDNLAAFSSPFFYRSFVRQFAQQVKIDYLEVSAGVDELAGGMPQPRMPGEQELAAANPKVRAIRMGRPKRLRWLYSLTSLMLMLVFCSGFYNFWEKSRSQLPATLAGLLQRLPIHPAQAAAAAPQLSADRIPAHEAAGLAVRVELSAIERTWLSTVADGVQTFNGTLEPEDTKVLEGHQTARIRTANAGGLTVIFNGKPIGSLGPRGQLRTVVFTRTGYRTLDSAPAPAAHLLITPLIPNGE